MLVVAPALLRPVLLLALALALEHAELRLLYSGPYEWCSIPLGPIGMQKNRAFLCAVKREEGERKSGEDEAAA